MGIYDSLGLGSSGGRPPGDAGGRSITNLGDVYTTGWFRATGNGGLYFHSFGGGWHMTDSTWIRSYNNKNIYTEGEVQAGTIRANNNLYASIFYDRNNTSFFVDPAGTSYFNDFRANIFYDRNNTEYYVDPSGTSKFQTINLGGVSLSSWPSGGDSDWLLTGSDMYSGASGNVGIGTTSPSEKLEVAGDVKISGTGNGLIFPDGTKQTTAAAPVYFSVKRDASYTWPYIATWLKVDFSSNSTVWANVGGGFNTSTSTFTAPISGVYTFHGTIYFQGLSSGDLIYAQIGAGGKYYFGNLAYANGSVQSVTASITVHLDAGQTASLFGYVSSSPAGQVYGNTTTTYAFTYFTGARVF